MRELAIGAVGLVVLAAIFLLVGRQAQSHPRGGCGGCALSSVCERRSAGESAGPQERQACYVDEEGEKPPV